MIAVSHIMKRKIKKIFFEVMSNSKIFKIIFFNKIVNDQDFPKLTGGGTRQRGGGTRQRGGGLDSVEYGNSQIICEVIRGISGEILVFLDLSDKK